MQSWLSGVNGLEGFLEAAGKSPTTHADFRVFLSSEPPPLSHLLKTIPETILKNSFKVANEAPSDLKANLRRAYAHFSQEFLDGCAAKPGEFKACLFALSFLHSLLQGRRKFGFQGWSRVYHFNDGDLLICSNVLLNYLGKYEHVPWADLRYLFGEIMYGGHITDEWDRRVNRTYLDGLMRPELLQPHFYLAQSCKSPEPSRMNFQAYQKYIEDSLPLESP